MAHKVKSLVASERVQLQWQRRVSAEYGSAAIASQLLHWLIQLGVSPDLLYQCQEVVREELMHTDLSREVYLAAGGGDQAIFIHPQQLVIPHAEGEELIYRALEFTADFFCCGETVAAPLFRAMVEGTTIDIAKKSLMRIVKDEEGHGEFGWELLEELLSISTSDQRNRLKERVSGFVSRIVSTNQMNETIRDDETIWGLLSGKVYADITATTASEVLVPNFKSLLK